MQRDPKCRIEPMPGRIVVKPEKEESGATQMASGLFIVSAVKERPSTAPIVAIGDDTEAGEDEAVAFTLGDIVLFSIHAGIKVSFGKRGEDEYIILRAGEILGRIMEVDNATSSATKSG